MTKEYELYVIPGSRHSQEAERCLEQSNLPYKKVVLNNRDLLAAASIDLGIQKAPALYVEGHWYQGLRKIKDFIRKNGE